MPVELRKRKEAPPAPAPPTKKKAPAKTKKADSEKTVVEKVQETVAEKVETVKEAVAGKPSNGASAPKAAGGAPKVGDSIDLSTFGGEVETNDGNKTTLAKLVEESKGGVVLFTYPKASTPGCKHCAHNVIVVRFLTHTIRHNPGLPLPRLLHASDCNWLLHLRSLE